ncbi:MAG: family 16 glycoside hydrolase [Verrucomicrobiota bacterium]
MIRSLLALALLLSLDVLGADWKPLWDGKTMKGWIKAPFGGSGDVEIEDGVLTLHQGLLTGVNCTNPIPKVDYEVEVEARRVSGNDFFCGLTFPVKDSFATLIVGGWGGSVVGISSLDDNDAAHNETTLHKRFDAGKWYRIRLQISVETLSVWIDDVRVIQASIKGRKVALRPGDIEVSKPFGIAAYSTMAEIRSVRLRDLSKPSGTGSPAETSATSKP